VSPRILVVDNRDSFVHNLVQYLEQLGARCELRPGDTVGAADVARVRPDGILLSPGPGHPRRAVGSLALIRGYADRVPILGVCLGHQAIALAYGAPVLPCPELMHGKTSLVHHHGVGVLAGLPDPFTATRYHSLAVPAGQLPDELTVTARTDSGVVMGLRHRELPLQGVQFHPESILSEGGHTLLANWLVTCGDPAAPDRAPRLAAQVERLRRTAFAGQPAS
jgi:para-aminobenzoate synthetase component 2